VTGRIQKTKADVTYPLRNSLDFERRAGQWDEDAAKWRQGLRRDLDTDYWEPITPELQAMTYAEYAGPHPDPQEYMPQWPHPCAPTGKCTRK
jgi:hypothetical protein